MRKVVGTRIHPIMARNSRTMPPPRVTVVESWGLVRMAMNGCMRTSCTWFLTEKSIGIYLMNEYIYIRVPDE